jgi:Putative adipose-regulatory protein (Seipin)
VSLTVDDTEIRNNNNGSFQLISNVLHVPLRLLHSISSTSIATLRPYAPQIIPVLICVLFIPLVILFSVFAGFVVWRSVAVDWETLIHLQFGCVLSLSSTHQTVEQTDSDGVSPYAIVPLPTLVSQQHYDISLRMTIPATESNYALGNFMTSLTLTTPSNKTLTSVRRPVSHYRRADSLLLITAADHRVSRKKIIFW